MATTKELLGKEDLSFGSGTFVRGTSTGGITNITKLSSGVEVFNVKDYGAVGDGVTDDTASIQLAIDAAVGGSLVVLPPTSTSYYISTGNISLPTDKTIFLSGSGTAVTVATANPVFKTNSGTAATAPRHIIEGFEFTASTTGTGIGIRLVDSQQHTVRDCFFNGLSKAIAVEIDAFWCEANNYENLLIRACDYGIWFSKTGAASGNSFASQRFSHVAITSSGANATIPYGIYIDTNADLYRSEFDQLILFPAKTNAVAFWCNGKIRNAHGSIHVEGNDGTVTANKGFWFGSSASLIHADIQSDLRGTVAEFFKWDGASTEMDGFMTRHTTEPPAHLRRVGVLSRIRSIVDTDLTTFHWKEHVTTSNRLQFQVNQTTPPEFVRIDDTSSLAPVRIMPVGSESAGIFVDADTTPSVKGKTFMKASNTGATTITAFDDGVAGQRFILQHTNANTTISNNVNIILTGSVNFTGTTHAMQEFLYDGSLWREISRVVV